MVELREIQILEIDLSAGEVSYRLPGEWQEKTVTLSSEQLEQLVILLGEAIPEVE